jgi:hypothetical protein
MVITLKKGVNFSQFSHLGAPAVDTDVVTVVTVLVLVDGASVTTVDVVLVTVLTTVGTYSVAVSDVMRAMV